MADPRTSEVVGAIDIGSNAMRYGVGRLAEDGSLKVLRAGREPVSLGRSVFDGGEISKRTIQLACAALRRFRSEMTEEGALSLRAVGTSALRDATNQREFLEAVQESSETMVEVISGEEEAELIRLAVNATIDLTRSTALLLDIGGGSVEVSVLSRGKVLFSRSETMGAVRLLKKLGRTEEGSETFSKLVRRAIRGFLDGLDPRAIPKGLDFFIATGGNVEALGDLRVRLFDKKNRKKLKQEELESMVETLVGLSYRERIEKFGFREDRADVIVPAAIVLLEVMRFSEVSRVEIPNVGLREGVLLSLLGTKGKR